MSSTLVGYSSGEDEYGNEKKGGGQRQSDANYDDVQMDMSDDDEGNPSNNQLFSSKDDFKAYNEKFGQRNRSKPTTYGNSKPSSEYGSGHSNVKQSSSQSRDSKQNDSSSDNDNDYPKAAGGLSLIHI